MKKNVLYICHSNNSYGSRGYRHQRFISFLKKRSSLDVINYGNEIKPKSNVIKRIFVKFLKILLVPDYEIMYRNRYKKTIVGIIRKKKYDTIILTVLPFSFLSLIKYTRKHASNRTKIILDITDPITINAKFNEFSNKKKRVLKKYEKEAFENIDVLIVLNIEIKDIYLKRYPKLKIIVIEQGIDNEVGGDIVQTSKYRGKKLNLIYTGIFYSFLREPFELYRAIEKIDIPIIFNIYGLIIKKYLPPETEKINFGGHLLREQLAEKYSQNDIIVFIDNRDSIQVPGKILEMLAFCKPLLFIYYNDDSPTIRYTKNYDGVFYVKNKSIEIEKMLCEIVQKDKYYYERDLTKYYWSQLLCRIMPII